MPDIKPFDDGTDPSAIKVIRSSTSQRYREQQPAFNQPNQDSLKDVRDLVE